MKLSRSKKEECSQGRLVKCGEDHPEDGGPDGQLQGPFTELLPVEPLESGWTKFEELDREVEGYVPGHQKQNGGCAERDEHRVRKSPGTAQVNEKKDNGEEVAKKAGKKCRPEEGMVFFEPEEVYGRGQDISCG